MGRDRQDSLVSEQLALHGQMGPSNEEIVAKERPVVRITSNNEKQLPGAFLGRCVFFFIEFPEVALMRRIIDVHHPHLDAKMLDQVLIKFYWLREQNELRKKPSTSGPRYNQREATHRQPNRSGQIRTVEVKVS